MFNFSKGFNNMNNNNKLVSGYKKNLDGGVRSLNEVKEDVNNAKFRAEKIKRDEFNKINAEKNNLNGVNPNLNSTIPSFKTRVDNLNNLKKGNF